MMLIILDYITSNKEWIFSGIGVTVITIVSSYIIKKHNRIKSEPVKKIDTEISNDLLSNESNIIGSGNTVNQTIQTIHNSPTTITHLLTPLKESLNDYPDYPDPSSIFLQYKSLTPFHKIHNKTSIAGARIKTIASYRSINILREDELKSYYAIFRYIDNNTKLDISISMDINIEDFPIFRTLHEDEQCLIAGIIKSISDFGINIELRLIEFYKTKKANDV
jgi:hypothetical protein